jgi:hypothetical protein
LIRRERLLEVLQRLVNDVDCHCHGLDLRLHHLQPGHRLGGNFLRAGPGEITGRHAKRTAELLQQRHLIRGRGYFARDASDHRIGVERLLTQPLVLAHGYLGKGRRENVLIAKRPRRRTRPKDVLENHRQGQAWIDQRGRHHALRHAFGRLRARRLCPCHVAWIGAHIERMMPVMPAEWYADMERAYAQTESRGR